MMGVPLPHIFEGSKCYIFLYLLLHFFSPFHCRLILLIFTLLQVLLTTYFMLKLLISCLFFVFLFFLVFVFFFDFSFGFIVEISRSSVSLVHFFSCVSWVLLFLLAVFRLFLIFFVSFRFFLFQVFLSLLALFIIFNLHFIIIFFGFSSLSLNLFFNLWCYSSIVSRDLRKVKS